MLANTHWGKGGANQYYIKDDVFNEAINAGIFKYNEQKSYREHNNTLIRTPVTNDMYDVMEDLKKYNIDNELTKCKDINAITPLQKAVWLNKRENQKLHFKDLKENLHTKYIAVTEINVFNKTQNRTKKHRKTEHIR